MKFTNETNTLFLTGNIMIESKEKRPVGRPRKSKDGFVAVCISIPKELREKLRQLGGSAWIAEQIKKA